MGYRSLIHDAWQAWHDSYGEDGPKARALLGEALHVAPEDIRPWIAQVIARPDHLFGQELARMHRALDCWPKRARTKRERARS